MKPQPWVVVVGDVPHGYKIYGPFNTKHEAQKFVPNGDPVEHGHTVVVQLLRPEE